VVQDSVLAIQRHWLERQRAGEEAETSGTDHLRTAALVEAAYASAAAGGAIIELAAIPVAATRRSA
jgi:hypothetical protein